MKTEENNTMPAEAQAEEMQTEETQNAAGNTESAAALSDAALQRLISEAEERGYRRGRNEKISMAMEQWETSVDLAPDLLLTPRKSLWD